MPIMLLRTSLCILALLSDAAVCSASTAAPPPSSAGNPLLQKIRAGLSAEEYIDSILQPFDEMAGKAGVIKVQDMRDRQNAQAASRRASAIGAVLRYDLNGDLRVTADEVLAAQKIDAPTPHPARTKKVSAARAEWDRLLLRYDTNRDGAVDMPEVSQAAALEDRPSRANPIAALLDSDLGKDGKLTRKEVKAFAQRTFKTIDVNKDGRISSEEYTEMCAAPLSFAAQGTKANARK